jgi:hypothetical protein
MEAPRQPCGASIDIGGRIHTCVRYAGHQRPHVNADGVWWDSTGRRVQGLAAAFDAYVRQHRVPPERQHEALRLWFDKLRTARSTKRRRR